AGPIGADRGRRARPRQGSPRARAARGARHRRRQGLHARVLRRGLGATRGRLRAARGDGAHHTERSAACGAPLFRPEPAQRRAGAVAEGGLEVSVSPNVAPTPPGGEPLVLMESSRALPLASLTVALRTGAIEDPPGKEGLTRLGARLM